MAEVFLLAERTFPLLPAVFSLPGTASSFVMGKKTDATVPESSQGSV